jgi:hypothetical protein
LKQQADASREDFSLLLTRFGMERLLYRLSISTHASLFILKGALAFSLWFDHPHRPKRDSDVLGFGSAEIDRLATVFREVMEITVDDDIKFDASSLGAIEIREGAWYSGIRVEANATFDGARIKLQIDIGFGVKQGKAVCSPCLHCLREMACVAPLSMI